MNMMKNINSQSGQIGVVVLLVMTAMLTVGIGAVSRSTYDLRITRQETEASRAFNAAEAGVERALYDIDQSVNGGGTLITEGQLEGDLDFDVNYSIAELRSINTIAQEGDLITFHLDQASTDATTIEIGWAAELENLEQCASYDPAKLLISVYNPTNPDDTTRLGFSKCPDHQGLSAVNPGDNVLITAPPGSSEVRVKILGNDTDLNITGSGPSIPIQGHLVTSTATPKSELVGQSVRDTNETKVVQLEKLIPSSPSILDYALVSGTTIIMSGD